MPLSELVFRGSCGFYASIHEKQAQTKRILYLVPYFVLNKTYDSY
jgi:hypothetical protein